MKHHHIVTETELTGSLLTATSVSKPGETVIEQQVIKSKSKHGKPYTLRSSALTYSHF
ncbi:hypothetical protein AB4254_16505 [Vibrio breoganii]